MTKVTPTPESLAREFSDAINALLLPEEVLEIVQRNREETDPRICHTHDFCDANQVLLDVFMKHGMDIADEGGLDRWGRLWDESWKIAKASDFWTT